MKQVLVKRGNVIIEDIPMPTVTNNTVLVKTFYSLISTGTEMGSIEESSESIVDKIRKKPELVRKGLDAVREHGLMQTYKMATKEEGAGLPLGYSMAGEVLDVGSNITDIKPGDRVACAGAGLANHAEFVNIPRNLLVKIPENISLKNAATITLGAIALQGVRQANPKIGETLVVTGLGLLGLLTVQIVKANGCRVIGLDTDKKRCELAGELGADFVLNTNNAEYIERINAITEGMGADVSIITASTTSSAPVNQAMNYTRKKGTVVVVGAVGMSLKRVPFYQKEIDFKISCSYGPGRYDPDYEEKGCDYPHAYVRWTENRNMQAYLDLIENGKINLKHFTQHEYAIEDAPSAYSVLKGSDDRPLAIVLKYPEQIKEIPSVTRMLKPDPEGRNIMGHVRVGLIGAGAFATTMHLPNLMVLSDKYKLKGVVDIDGVKAKGVADKYKAEYTSTDYREILADNDIDLVFITTRHNSHASIAIDALKAGKAVFIEKPMALNKDELNKLSVSLNETNLPFLVGFNRRFSPFAKRIKELVTDRISPMIIDYQMNAGFIPPEHWTQGEDGGGRNIGEACHIYDLFTFFTESQIERITAGAIGRVSSRFQRSDNFTTTLHFKDGSICNLVYTALGSRKYSKEQMKVYYDNKMIVMDDYKTLKVYGDDVKGLKLRRQDKGHLEQLRCFAEILKSSENYPIPLWQLTQATEISFEVEKLIHS